MGIWVRCDGDGIDGTSRWCMQTLGQISNRTIRYMISMRSRSALTRYLGSSQHICEIGDSKCERFHRRESILQCLRPAVSQSHINGKVSIYYDHLWFLLYRLFGSPYTVKHFPFQPLKASRLVINLYSLQCLGSCGFYST